MKQNLLQKLLSILKTEQPELVIDHYDQTMLRMSVIGLFDTIENIAKAGKLAVNNSTALPTSLLRLYLNGIVNSCALAEEAMSTKKDTADEPSQEESLDVKESKQKPIKQKTAEPVIDKKSDIIDGDAFDFIVKTFKKSKK